jgi:hypothetical protein
MASDKHMVETLSTMLQDNETLTCSIFGYVKDGGFQQFAYFGFTETHFLIAYLLGEKVEGTVRIPLNITSIKVKKLNFLNEYIFDILFDKKRSYTICAFSKVLKIKSQEENFPLFLDLLKSKAKKTMKSLAEIEGEKIRRQYFNTFIYIMLAFIPAVPVMIIAQELRKGNFDIWNTIAEMSGATPTIAVMYGIILGPFIVLSIFNRFSYGKILGVTNEGSLFLENRQIPINDIVEIFYHPRVMSRIKISFPYATFVVKSDRNELESFDIIHFPIYGLRKIKKYNKDIKLSCDKYIWFLILCPTLMFAVFGFLLG